MAFVQFDIASDQQFQSQGKRLVRICLCYIPCVSVLPYTITGFVVFLYLRGYILFAKVVATCYQSLVLLDVCLRLGDVNNVLSVCLVLVVC